ncbi:hypothetical protein [Moorena sp. SIOASIH]|uniref:hypothetical protein n=1 Tax=Moorena sp. SIOASIH TaxID=2607817 RepID=UPI0025E0A59A|nr:hypothetical protein [Moorena sp. SIOASIH]
MIKTDFAGRSLDMSNDESLTEYQELIGKLFNSMESLAEQASEPIVVAKVIYEAATDGTDKLRYTAGEDARMMVANRKELDDKTFIQGIKEQFSI